MAANRRVLRAEKEIHQIVSEYMITGLKVPLKGMVSISHVTISSDLRSGKVFVNELLPNEFMDENVETLNKFAPYFQKEIDKRLRMKFCPKLKFINNLGFENSKTVEKILKDLSKSTEEEA